MFGLEHGFYYYSASFAENAPKMYMVQKLRDDPNSPHHTLRNAVRRRSSNGAVFPTTSDEMGDTFRYRGNGPTLSLSLSLSLYFTKRYRPKLRARA